MNSKDEFHAKSKSQEKFRIPTFNLHELTHRCWSVNSWHGPLDKLPKSTRQDSPPGLCNSLRAFLFRGN